MNKFNHTTIKTININMNKGSWNPETHSITLSYDPTHPMKFSMKMVKVVVDEPISDVSQAALLLQQFRK